MFKAILKNVLPLMIITLVAALLLSTVNLVTKDKIAQAEEKEKNESYCLIFPEAASFVPVGSHVVDAYKAESKASVDAVYVAKSENGGDEGIVISVSSPNGYGGKIELSVGIDTDCVITGVRVTRMNETSGLGSNCQNPNWLAQFVSKTAKRIGFTRNGKPNADEVDAISQATITTKAVLEAVNEGLGFSRYYYGLTGGTNNE